MMERAKRFTELALFDDFEEESWEEEDEFAREEARNNRLLEWIHKVDRYERGGHGYRFKWPDERNE